ncbi:DUF4838 domain-containing protein [Paenibacillus sp. GXUN7292]|uniref:DUF4838 domain-containing protein n=1 Tax=Paenibacillus sp. GXUN7292 TaxID=3422499 RepID=UPI003D7CFF8B
MKNSHVRPFCIMLLVCLFAMTPILGLTPSVEASQTDEENEVRDIAEPSFEGLLQLIEQLETEGAFKNRGASQSLKAQLQTVIRFKQRGDLEQAQHHFEKFQSTLDKRFEQGSISMEGYERLEAYMDAIVNPAPPEEELTIVNQGQSNAVIIVEDDAAPEALEAAAALEGYIKKATGATIPVMTANDFSLQENDFTGQTRINVDHYTAKEASHIETALEGLDDQGFVIRPHEDTITIIGPTAFGTRNGAYDFLERYADIRWLMPGPEGVDIPQSADLLVPMIEVIEDPVFAHRLISAGLDSDEWWKANKLQLGTARTVRFQENLYTLFPPEKFLATHPEFYPVGSNPKPGDKYSYQPCFTAAGSVDAAVQGIIDYFAANPTATSFSLGINDNINFCETDPNHPYYPGVLNSIGFVNMSEIYYAWVNEVVEQVLEVYPDKWFGLLAYYNVMDPPSFPVHPRVVPFITKDRMAWMDDDIRAAGHQQMEDWQAKAEQIGWYDYMYGTLYVLPRVYPHLMAETLQYAAQNNVYGHYNEMYHNAGDGPKAWLNAKLMWNPDQDVDVLLQEWYERTVGPEAAEDLAALYDYWEDIWTDRMQQSAWFIRNKDSTYLRFEEQDYVEMITKADFDISMPLIESVVAKAGTSLQKSRANKLLSMFKYYEASALSYSKDIDPIEDEVTALAVLDNIEANLADRVEYGSQRDPLWLAFSNDPILRFRTNHWYQWFGYNRTEFWNVVNYLRNNEPNGGTVTNSVIDLASNDDSSAVGMFANMLRGVNERSLVSYTTNSSFEEGSSAASPWMYWNPNGTANIGRVTDVAHTGSASLLVGNATHRAGAYQIFDVQSGLTAAEVYYYSPPGTDRGGVRLVATLQGANGKTLGDIISPTMPLADTAGEWASVSLFEWIPASIRGETVKKVLLNAQVWEAAGTQVYLDNVHFYVMESAVDNSIVLTQNGSFEQGDESAVLPWKFWNDLSIGTMKRTEDMARTGEASLQVSGLERGGIFQHVESVGGDELLARLYFYTAQGSETTGDISIVMHALAQNYERLQTFNSVKIPLSAGLGEWTPVELQVTVPATINGKSVARFQVIATIDKAQDAVIYIDDFDVYKK